MTVLKFQNRNKSNRPTLSISLHPDGRIDSIVLGRLTESDRRTLISAINTTKQEILRRHRRLK